MRETDGVLVRRAVGSAAGRWEWWPETAPTLGAGVDVVLVPPSLDTESDWFTSSVLTRQVPGCWVFTLGASGPVLR